MWRAVFNGLFAKVGTLIDRRSGTQSLLQIAGLCERYGDSSVKTTAKKVRVALESRAGLIEKFEAWRYKVVAHRTAEGYEALFRADNKMDLREVAAGLSQLEGLINELSIEATSVHNDSETGSEALIDGGKELFRMIAVQLKSEASKQS